MLLEARPGGTSEPETPINKCGRPGAELAFFADRFFDAPRPFRSFCFWLLNVVAQNREYPSLAPALARLPETLASFVFRQYHERVSPLQLALLAEVVRRYFVFLGSAGSVGEIDRAVREAVEAGVVDGLFCRARSGTEDGARKEPADAPQAQQRACGGGGGGGGGGCNAAAAQRASKYPPILKVRHLPPRPQRHRIDDRGVERADELD